MGGPDGKLRYEEVKDLILSTIADKRLQPGDQLPTSSELARMSGYSMISVRRALDELERAGRIVRRQGVGTFVAQNRIMTEPTRSGQLLDTLGGGTDRRKLRTELVSLRPAVPSSTIAELLNIKPGIPVWEIRRVRKVGSTPLIVETARIPLQLAPTIDERWLAAGKSLYGMLATKYNLLDQHEEQSLEVVTPEAGDRKLLGLAARASAVRIRGVSYTQAGVPFDCFEQVYPADQFTFFVSGSQKKHLLPAHHGGDWSVTPLA